MGKQKDEAAKERRALEKALIEKSADREN